MNKRLVISAIVLAGAAAAASAPLSFAKGGVGGGGGVAVPAAPGNDLAVVLSGTSASPASAGSFSYSNLAGKVSLLVQVKGAAVGGSPVVGPAVITVVSKSLDCATSTTDTITGMVFSVKGEAKFQPANPQVLTGFLSRSRSTVTITAGGVDVAQATPSQACIPGHP